MARVYTSSVINASAARVWARVRDFNGLSNWHPAIAESRIENGEPADKVGCIRNFSLRNGDGARGGTCYTCQSRGISTTNSVDPMSHVTIGSNHHQPR